MIHLQFGAILCAKSVTELVLLKLNINADRALSRLVLNGFGRVRIAIGIHGVAEESDVVHDCIACVIGHGSICMIQCFHVCIVVVTIS